MGDISDVMGKITDKPEFKEWPKIQRWSKQLWVITEKIDGTNACVIVPEDKEQPLAFQSRNRIITTENDNFGFAKWGVENAEQLRWLGPGYHYGEWWGSGVNRSYGLVNGEKRFSLFNTRRWNLETPQSTPPPCCKVVPVLELCTANISNSIQFCMDELKKAGSKAAPGFMDPEGIVICHAATGTLFKKTYEDTRKGVINE